LTTLNDEQMDLGRIAVDHRIMCGIPCVAGTRFPVVTVVGLVTNRLTTDEILAEYPQLTCEDVRACLGTRRGLKPQETPRLLPTSLSGDLAVAIREHGSATLDEH
jgi:uncharacterized protein (DUF433 family)